MASAAACMTWGGPHATDSRAAAVAAAALGRMVFECTHDGSPADIQQGPRGFMAENPRFGEASHPGPMTDHRASPSPSPTRTASSRPPCSLTERVPLRLTAAEPRFRLTAAAPSEIRIIAPEHYVPDRSSLSARPSVLLNPVQSDRLAVLQQQGQALFVESDRFIKDIRGQTAKAIPATPPRSAVPELTPATSSAAASATRRRRAHSHPGQPGHHGFVRHLRIPQNQGRPAPARVDSN